VKIKMTQKEIKKLKNAFTRALLLMTGLVLLVFLMWWLIETFEKNGIISIFVAGFLFIFTSAFYLVSEE